MDTAKLKDLAKAANEAVKDLDPDLKKSAFETILNKLLEENLGVKSTKKKKRANKTSSKTKTQKKTSKEVNVFDESTDKLITGINTSKYPRMFHLGITLDRALYLLKIAKDDFDIDGLVPSQMSNILKTKFRVKASPNAISMALMNKLKYVDRRPVTIQGGSGFSYHIMHEGEKYLDEVLAKTSEET